MEPVSRKRPRDRILLTHARRQWVSLTCYKKFVMSLKKLQGLTPGWERKARGRVNDREGKTACIYTEP
jgi:hypothetical protein